MGNDYVLERFRLHEEVRGLSKSTIARRNFAFRGLLDSSGNVELARITVEQIEDYLILHRNLQTRHCYLSDIRQLFKFMTARGLIERNPCDLIDSPRVPSRDASPVSVRNVRRMLDSAGETTRCMVMLMAMAGLRCSEVATLRGEDVDLDSLLISIRAGKGNKDGTVPLAGDLATELEHWPRRGRLFPHWYDRSSVYGRVKRLMQSLDIAGRPHDLRHSFGTQAAVKSKGNLRAVQKLMRHSSISTTMRYVRYHPDGRDIVDALYGGDAA